MYIVEPEILKIVIISDFLFYFLRIVYLLIILLLKLLFPFTIMISIIVKPINKFKYIYVGTHI